MHPMVNVAVKAARKAGDIIIRYAERIDSLKITTKSPNDFVTEVDQVAEKEIIAILRNAYPQHAILSEETDSKAKHAEYVWIIDPLDGTTNYIHGFPQFAVSIACQHNNKLMHAVVYDPLRQELFTASSGQGAQMNNRKLRVSKTSKFEEALLGTGFPFRNRQYIHDYMRIFQALFEKVGDIRRAGAAALDLAYVAAGRLDGFWEFKLSPWDIAAGALLIKEAGGFISDFQGEHHYLTSGHVVAGNPQIFKPLLQTIQSKLIKQPD